MGVTGLRLVWGSRDLGWYGGPDEGVGGTDVTDVSIQTPCPLSGQSGTGHLSGRDLAITGFMHFT